jgi:hypothetical protein
METNFNEFLNEYGGPRKTIGFRYSEPNIDYTFSIVLIINPALKSSTVKSDIAKIFKEANVEEDWIKLVHEKGDGYKLTIGMKGYSKFELLAMTNVLFKKVHEKFKEDIVFILDSVELTGADIDDKTKNLNAYPPEIINQNMEENPMDKISQLLQKNPLTS